MTKIYIIVDCCSGEDYSQDDPTILFVSSNYKEARDFFDDEISNWEGDGENVDSYVEEYEDYILYECTDPIGDSHRIMKMVERELN